MSAPAAETVRTVPRITGLSTRLLTVALRRSWGAEAPENHVIATEVSTDDGGTGFGFSWTPTIGPQAVKALFDHDIAPFVTGLPATPEVVWDVLCACPPLTKSPTERKRNGSRNFFSRR